MPEDRAAWRERKRRSRQNPEVAERDRERTRRRRQNPEARAHDQARDREYKRRRYQEDPAVRLRRQQYNALTHLRKQVAAAEERRTQTEQDIKRSEATA